MPISKYKVVLDNLNHKTKSNPNKTVAEAILDGTITIEDLREINSTITFPANNFNRFKLPEGEYASQDMMFEFVNVIGPYLSDQALFSLTDKLASIETGLSDQELAAGKKMLAGNQQAYRTSTLARCFMMYEVERHRNNLQDGLPKPFLHHMKKYVIPLCEIYWPDKMESNFNNIGSFNILEKLEGGRGNLNDKCYQPCVNFNLKSFSASTLSATVPNQNTQQFLADCKRDWEARKTEPVSPTATTTTTASDLKKQPISEPSKPIETTSLLFSQPQQEKLIKNLKLLRFKMERAKDSYDAVNSIYQQGVQRQDKMEKTDFAAWSAKMQGEINRSKTEYEKENKAYEDLKQKLEKQGISIPETVPPTSLHKKQ